MIEKTVSFDLSRPGIIGRSFLALVVGVFLLGHISPSFATALSGKRVLYIDSYHVGNAWSDNISRSIQETLAGTGVVLRIHQMDTRHNRSEVSKKQAGVRAKAAIEEFAPDIVIVSDDNAVKYVLQPFYRDADLPFVFCGVNWDATVYGLPYKNTTGMVEVGLARELINTLKTYAQGTRIGYIGLNSLSNRNNIKGHNRLFGISYDKVYLVDDFKDWKQRYLALQGEVDMIVMGNHEGMANWNEADAMSHVRRHTRIPSGVLTPGRIKLALMGYVRKPEEQGTWAARAALKILGGTPPADIALTRNKQGVLKINEALRAKLGLSISPALFKRAEIIKPYQGRKVFYVSSYLPDKVRWSKEIRRAVLKTFEGAGIKYREFFMGTKQNPLEEYAKAQALVAKKLIEEMQPDVVITSDDAAVKYLVAPYFSSSLPFVFVGVNWDVSPYGLPTDNVTGMIEVGHMKPLLAQLRRYAKGDRIGILSESSLTHKKHIEYHRKLLGIHYDKNYAVGDFAQWKEAFLKLQDEVDMLIVRAPFGVRGWNAAEAKAFVEKHVKIPTGGQTVERMPWVLMGYVRLPEEQGEWAGETALRILDGVTPKDIKVTRNKRGKLLLNRRMFNLLGITIDRSLYRLGEFIE
jgi:ABC-type uncharacterized transport system substrate-binding protein